MVSKKVKIMNETGIHARPASIFVSAASKYQSKITLNKLDDQGNIKKTCPAKSIISVLGMGLAKGTVIELLADGADEEQALEALVNLIEIGLGET